MVHKYSNIQNPRELIAEVVHDYEIPDDWEANCFLSPEHGNKIVFLGKNERATYYHDSGKVTWGPV